MSFTIRKERKKDYRQGLRVIFVDDAVLHKSLLLHSTWDALSFRFRVFVSDKRTERICTDKKLHFKCGRSAVRETNRGTDGQTELVQQYCILQSFVQCWN